LLTSIKILLTCQNAFAAGVDTTYITLNWAMAELIKNTDTMKKLQDEVRGIVKPNDMIKTEALNENRVPKSCDQRNFEIAPSRPIACPKAINGRM
jgi:cytochrome P450